MRATLADTALTRLAGRFVWLELDYDKPANRDFMKSRGVSYTPSLYVLDPSDERATATHFGGLTLPELTRFLERGERGVRERSRSPADESMARGDALLGRGRIEEATAAYRRALGLAAPGWAGRTHAVGSLAWALWAGGEIEACAETAAVEAPRLARGEMFGRVVLAGFASANRGGQAPWARSARRTLEPLAKEAVGLSDVLRDHRFQLYEQLMIAADARGDSVHVVRWGHRWLDEIESVAPRDDDERSALDIARVDAASDLGEPERVIPALVASERLMPANYNASLRLAQMELAAGRYDEALAACERGLAHVTGPMGRAWILEVRANSLIGKGDDAAARRALEQALRSAQTITNPMNREHRVLALTRAIARLDAKGR